MRIKSKKILALALVGIMTLNMASVPANASTVTHKTEVAGVNPKQVLKASADPDLVKVSVDASDLRYCTAGTSFTKNLPLVNNNDVLGGLISETPCSGTYTAYVDGEQIQILSFTKSDWKYVSDGYYYLYFSVGWEGDKLYMPTVDVSFTLDESVWYYLWVWQYADSSYNKYPSTGNGGSTIDGTGRDDIADGDLNDSTGTVVVHTAPAIKLKNAVIDGYNTISADYVLGSTKESNVGVEYRVYNETTKKIVAGGEAANFIYNAKDRKSALYSIQARSYVYNDDVTKSYSKWSAKVYVISGAKINIGKSKKTMTAKSIKLYWGSVQGAKDYTLYKSKNNKKWVKVKTLKGTSYKVKGIKLNNKKVYFKVVTSAKVSGKTIKSSSKYPKVTYFERVVY